LNARFTTLPAITQTITPRSDKTRSTIPDLNARPTPKDSRINLFFLIGNVVALLLVDRLGRRPILIWGFVLSGLGLLFLAIKPDAGLWVIAFAFAIYALFNGGPSILEWIYPNELFPTEVRATAVGLCTGISRIGAAIGTFATPWALSNLGLSATMYIAAGIAGVGALVSFLMAPETRGTDLSDAASLR
jgi:putative MFS transporter